jgi:hypothetical protein
MKVATVTVSCVALCCTLLVVSVTFANGLSLRESPRNPPCNMNANYKLENGTEVACSTLRTVEERAKHAGCRCANNGCCSKFGFCGTTDFYCLERWGCEKTLGACKDSNGKVIGGNAEKPADAPAPPKKDNTPPTPAGNTNGDVTNPSDAPKVIVKTISVACPTCKAPTPKPDIKDAKPSTAASKEEGTAHAIDEGPPKVCDADKDPKCINAAAKSLAQNTANAAAIVAAKQIAAQQAKIANANAASNAVNAAASKVAADKAKTAASVAAKPNLKLVATEGDSHRVNSLMDPSGY